MPTTTLDGLRADTARLVAAQRCADHIAQNGHWELDQSADAAQWKATDRQGCTTGRLTTLEARRTLRDQHIMVIGDLAARFWYSALLFLLNGTAGPGEVADGFPMHRSSAECVWDPDSMHRGGYDFGGWAHIKKTSPCFRRFYGHAFGTLLDKPLTLNHPPGSKAWWGRGSTRDVMTMLLRDSLLWGTWHEPSHNITLTYLWKGVIRTSASYGRQHARHLAEVATKVGTGPTIIVAAMGAYDSQWQDEFEVSKRLAGLYRGISERWPASGTGAPLLIGLGPSSCTPGKQYSHYQGRGTRHGSFHNLENASSLIPRARQAALNHSVLFVDTSAPQTSVPPLRSSPCMYDLPIGLVAEAVVQIALSTLVYAFSVEQ